MKDEDGASEESEDDEHQIIPDLKDVQQQHGNGSGRMFFLHKQILHFE
jgi:hypothetical protein